MAKRILIVDDAAFMRMMIKDILTKNGYGASVLVSIDMFDRLIKKQELYEAISRSESEIDAGLGLDAMSSLSKMRATLNV